MSTLLAVDLGIRTGLALFDQDGRVKSYQSRNFGTAGRLRQAVRGILHELPNVTWLVVEGGGPIAGDGDAPGRPKQAWPSSMRNPLMNGSKRVGLPFSNRATITS